MITLREPTSFDAIAPGDVAWVAEKSKNENLEAREKYAQKPYHDIQARVETSLHLELLSQVYSFIHVILFLLYMVYVCTVIHVNFVRKIFVLEIFV